MRRVWQGLVLVLVIAGMGAMGSTRAATPYMDPQGRFSFTAPDGYVQQQVGQLPAGVSVAAFGSESTAGARFVISTVTAPENAMSNADDLAAITIEQLAKGYQDMEIWSNGIVPAQVGGVEGRQYVYRATSPNSSVKVRGAIMVALRGDTSYSLSFFAGDGDFDKLADDCTPMLATFAFAGAQPASMGAGAVPTGPTATPRNLAG